MAEEMDYICLEGDDVVFPEDDGSLDELCTFRDHSVSSSHSVSKPRMLEFM